MGGAVGGIVGGVGSIVGGAMGSDAASSAADTQVKAADKAAETQRWMYEQNRGNLEPYNQFGQAGMNALAYRLGLGGVGPNGQSVSAQTYDQIRQELLPQFSNAGGMGGNPPDLRTLLGNDAGAQGYSSAQWGYDPQAQKWGYQLTYQGGGDAGNPYTRWAYANNAGGGTGSGSINEAGLEAAIQARLQQQQTAQAAAQKDPLYGSLLDTYKEYKPFSTADFQVDPGYQFRQQQGEQAIERMAAARGGLNSGRAAKDLAAFNSGLASQEYQNAYGRYNNDYLTGFNAFNTGQNNIFNRLMGVTGVGQSAANALAGVGGSAASQIADTQLQAGNAAAAGAMGQANAWSNALGGVTNSLQGYLARQPQGTSGYSGTFQPSSGVGGLSSGQGINGWW
ncbi:hypothetical protein [Achromobacter insolitus]|uniref:hypothetical protein n=1 Tax=Achromobacter insolitus TaxID=217204 RepID=UPI000AD08873|nr:hypothetical protein [Achromobacter insolitus]